MRNVLPHLRKRSRVRVKETVLLIGTAQPSAAPTARSIARAGYRVIGAWEGGRLAGRTRYCEQLFRIPPSSAAEFLAAVNEICERERVAAVLPLAEEFLGVLVAGRESDASWVLVGPSRAEFHALCNKAGLVETAAAAGIPSPASTVVTSDGPQGPLPPLPAYIKIVSGVDAGRATGRPVRVTDARARDAVIQARVAAGEAVLVQEEVNGELWRFHFARSGGRIAYLAVRTLASYPFRVGESSVSSFVPAPAALVEVGRALLDEVGYEGVGSLGFVERDGSFLAHDINLRMLGSTAGTIAAGLDMPRLAVEIALGRNPALEPVPVRPLHFVQLHLELAALRGAISGAPTGRSAWTIAAGVALAAVLPGRMLYPLDPRDPLPTLAVLAKAVRSH
jgi:carbamoyl-phosphate synthase large subunit